jgi:hypothetical protein
MSSAAIAELKGESTSSAEKDSYAVDSEKIDTFSVTDGDSQVKVIQNAEDVALEVSLD